MGLSLRTITRHFVVFNDSNIGCSLYHWWCLYKEYCCSIHNYQWRRLADLNVGRFSHGSIIIGGQTMIIGGVSWGQTPLFTEVWKLENGNNKIIQPFLPDEVYAYGIALYVVDKDF